MTEKLPERLNSDQIGGARNNSPEVKAGFDISRIPDTQKDIIISFGGKITPYIDEQGRPGVRITLPNGMQAYGGDWNKMEKNPIKGVIELDGATGSVAINKPLAIGPNGAMIVRIISTDVSGQRDYADIVLSKPPVQENISPNDQVERNMKNILNPQNNPQNIMDNIDYIVANANKLTPEQVVYFRNIMGSVVASNTGLEVVGYDRNVLNVVYLKYGMKHQSIQKIDYELSLSTLKQGSPQHNELLRRKGDILSRPPAGMTLTSANWRQVNFPDPYYLR